MPVRARLGLALVLALAPVLIVGAIEASLSAQRDAREHQAELAAAAERSAATARARIAAAEVLLQTLTPGSVGYQCATRLAEIKNRIPGYDNLIRFDEQGRVSCSAAGAPADPVRATRPWFAALANGAPITVTSQGGVPYADRPAILANVRALDDQGKFEGVLTAVIDLASLRPQTIDAFLPANSQVAITDSAGRTLSTTSTAAFPDDLGRHLAQASAGDSVMWAETDRRGYPRVFTSAPLVDGEAFVVLSAPTQTTLSWAVINPISAILLPTLAFLFPLLAVGFVADRGVVRWVYYLRRISAIYAGGRYSVRPTRTADAPPEFRQLAQTMGAMAETIAARDATLRQSLIEKEDLLREIHHRVKNNLQVISSLLNLQERTLVDPSARAAMSDTRQRISALALIYRTLYQGPDLRRVELRGFLDELIAQTLLSESVGGAPIRTELDIEELEMDADNLAPLALFAVEAITNAKKHGLDHGGVLSVTLHVTGDKAELVICDTGAPGAPPPQVGEGVGRTLMTAFARQLRGEVCFVPNKNGGLTARLAFGPHPGPSTPDLNGVLQQGRTVHPASSFRETDRAILTERVGERGFAVVIGVADGRPLVAHAPILLDGDRMRFHLSAANPLTGALRESGRAMAVITGDDAYVSPDWYEMADQVPTWNYLSVEIEGAVRVLTREEAALLLDDLSARYEAWLKPKPPWTRAKMDPAKFEALLSGIVGFEMPVERFEGITKLSQNKPPAEAARIAEALGKLNDDGARRIARRMVNRLAES
jgi:two-component sensor histidine kinase/predicted FMN-binding regulatory protein PaiB